VHRASDYPYDRIHSPLFPTDTAQQAQFPVSGVGAFDITAGSNGKIWFTEDDEPLGWIDPGAFNPQVQSLSTNFSNSDTNGITVGPNGTIWFTDDRTGQFGTVTPTPTPTPKPPPTPTVVSARIEAFYARHNEKGKPIGKPDAKVVVTCSLPMNTGAIDNAGNDQVVQQSVKKVKKKVQTVFHPVPIQFRATGSSTTVVALTTSVPLKKFARGAGHVRLAGLDPKRRRRRAGRLQTFTI
jgi:hypothetical protein